MLEIIFEDDHDVAAFLHLIQHSDDRNNIIVREGIRKIGIEKAQPAFSIQRFMEPILVKFFLECKEDEHMLSLIEGTYCFADQDEQQQILQLAHSIIEGEADDLPFEPLKLSRKQSILDELQTICLEEGLFSIRSFQTFRLGQYYKQLKDITEAAIDEYKMEQEYQNFIQTLRDYVTAKQPRIKKVHIVHDGSFTLWELRYVPEREKMKYIDRRFVRDHPMYIDSHLLAPLISIAPDEVVLYTDQPEHMMARTIQNVFQERMEMLPLHAFSDAEIPVKHSEA
ncbi:putative sporulation protein YtxC [Bacillus spizizenii]|uniref:putative sporulation protein YtxC n=1 Tax=Bacillus spizizenii TaxID=96241 RepID=UPI0005CB0A52|nr:putative sporulation protein YtxC [Bacillus spizizenii]MCY8041876.1 putative sporulation protein YtxC [Bacillus spizizenii]MCY8060215.1 putative sporulation protein YtxC [Bacillus spizizenii]MCY8111567.1 putative sporulation protein YtxC [Bacillus spizizenii]MCY8127943.1 putative sporulation protein YtxC [Bacillus spizizenii]MCY8153425.1 putative sporulation protein YtxC [Bacillus spizizenii]